MAAGRTARSVALAMVGGDLVRGDGRVRGEWWMLDCPPTNGKHELSAVLICPTNLLLLKTKSIVKLWFNNDFAFDVYVAESISNFHRS